MPAYRFIIVLFSQHHQFIIIRQTMGMMGQIPAICEAPALFHYLDGTFVTYSATAIKSGIGPKGLPV